MMMMMKPKTKFVDGPFVNDLEALPTQGFVRVPLSVESDGVLKVESRIGRFRVARVDDCRLGISLMDHVGNQLRKRGGKVCCLWVEGDISCGKDDEVVLVLSKVDGAVEDSENPRIGFKAE